MQTSLMIRPATAADIGQLLGLYMHLSSDNAPCPPDLARANLEKLGRYEGSAVLVGEVDDTLIVTCTLIVVPNLTRGGLPYAVIENVVTHPEHRQRGHGKAILETASERAWAHGCYKIMLSTGSKRPETLSFYESVGFTQSRTGFQKRKLPERAEPVGRG